MPSSTWYDISTPGDLRRERDQARRNPPASPGSGQSSSRELTQDELADLFIAMFGNDFVGGGVGGTDRQYTGGTINEYTGIGDAGFDMGSMMGKGSNRVSKMGGLAPSAFYSLDPNYEKYMNKTVRYDQDSNLWNMWMHPYDAERWGDYLPGSREERENLAERGSFRFGDGNIAGTDAITIMMDRMNQRRTGRR